MKIGEVKESDVVFVSAAASAQNCTLRCNFILSIRPSNLSLAIPHRIKLQGCLFNDHYNVLEGFQTVMSRWIKEGKVKWKETIYDNLESTPKSFIGLFDIQNIGKGAGKDWTRLIILSNYRNKLLYGSMKIR